jgi:hypothetical protein
MVGEDEVTLVGIIPRLPISNQNLKQHDAYGRPLVVDPSSVSQMPVKRLNLSYVSQTHHSLSRCQRWPRG